MNSSKKADMTFSELFDEWHNDKSKTVSDTAKRMYRSYFDKYIPDSLGSRKVGDISHDEWVKIENDMLGGKAPDGSNIPKTTSRQSLSVFHSVFRYGKKNHGLNDPSEGMQISSRDMYSVTVFTESEIKKMRAAAKPFDITHICIMLCLYTGVEVGEICAVKWKDIDTENRLLQIRRVVELIDKEKATKKGNLTASEPKNKKVIRDLPIPTWIAEQLEIMKPMHNDEEFLLAGPGGNAHPANFRARYASFLKSAGVEKRMITALRHTFAMTCIKKNVDVKTLSEMLGHSSTSVTTRMYYGKQSKNKRDIIEKLYE